MVVVAVVITAAVVVGAAVVHSSSSTSSSRSTSFRSGQKGGSPAFLDKKGESPFWTKRGVTFLDKKGESASKEQKADIMDEPSNRTKQMKSTKKQNGPFQSSWECGKEWDGSSNTMLDHNRDHPAAWTRVDLLRGSATNRND